MLFGTDGIRGRVGIPPFIIPHLIELGSALGTWARMRYGACAKLLVIHDTRRSSSFVKAALKTGLLHAAVDVVDGYILPTPGALHLMRAMPEINAAIIISASHNPAEDNGIKLIDAQRGKLSHEDEHLITTLLQSNTTTHCSPAAWGDDMPYPFAASHYITLLNNYFPGTWARGIRVVIDTAHGATYHIAPAVFAACGAEVIAIHDQPNGYNINCKSGSVYPQPLVDAVFKHAADIGFAFDGDGDRIVLVTRRGEIKNGDDILCCLLTHPDYQDTPAVVGTIMTNAAFEEHVVTCGKKLIRTAVGDKHVADAMELHNAMLGGEPAGHILLRNYLISGDGVLVALKVLETILMTGNWDIHTFHKYPQVLMNIPVTRIHNLHEEPFARILQDAHEIVQEGRISVRYSGTEPLLRVMIEAKSQERAAAVCTAIVDRLTRAFREYEENYMYGAKNYTQLQ